MIKQTNVEIPGVGKGNANPLNDIRAFLKGGFENCEVDASPYANAYNCKNAYASTASRAGLSRKVSVISRKGRVFLIRKESEE